MDSQLRPSGQSADAVASTAPYMPTDEDRKKYHDYHREMRHGMALGDQAADQAVLTLSAAALGVSLAFISDVRPNPTLPALLVASWVSFGAAILTTIGSFKSSRQAMQAMIDRLEQFYLQGQKDVYDKPIPEVEQTARLNQGAISFFALGIVLTIVFAAVNILQPTGVMQ